jgi:hypothetical protein
MKEDPESKRIRPDDIGFPNSAAAKSRDLSSSGNPGGRESATEVGLVN